MTDLLERPAPPAPAPVRGRHRRVEPARRPIGVLRPEWLTLASGALGLLSLVPVAPWLRAVLLAAFLLTGPGLATVLWMRLPAAAAVAVVPVTGMAVAAGATVTVTWAGAWLPVPLLLTLVAAVAGSAVLCARRRPRPALRWPAALAPGRWRVSAPYAWIVAALCVWAVALPGMAAAAESPLGLLVTGTGPVLVVVGAVLACVFVVALRTDALVAAAAAVGAAILVLRLTATLITDLPMYAWTYKHLGIVDYLLTNRVLPPSGVDVYREWPAFFTTFAWFSDVTSVDPTAVAHWFAPVVHVLLALVVGSLAATLGLDRRAVLAAVMVSELANWVAQDYFAPQAFAFVVGLGIIVALLAARVDRRAGWLAFLLFAALVPTHQLTPFWIFGVVVALTIARQIGPRWIVLPYAAVLFGYLYPRRYIVFEHGGLSSLNPLANGAGNVEYAGSLDKMITSLVCRGLSATIMLAAVVAAVVWWRRRRPVAVPAILAFSPFVLLGLSSYGGEAVFRVYLYALPGCAVLIAPLLVAAITARRAHHLAAVALALIAAAGLQGYYGTWYLNMARPSELALLNNLVDGARAPATVWSLHSAGMPTRATATWVNLAAHDDSFDTPIVERWPGFLDGFPDAGQFDDVTEKAAAAAGETYFVFTADAKTAFDYFGYAAPDTVDRFERMFATSPVWCLRLQDETTTVYRYQAGGCRS
ncbi:MAG: hypothetical protein HZB45_20115 [Mycolicibacterium rufum]|uniref:Glycosyltransferase RgtA/B/C/D-like domain-containing protein n=1 Tax=Mycolicibacterium chlorophenolicum TaxID=37916 RepID=A0A0J6YWI7_9MYCO|nr:hypothetical protein [Mycolicibacterium chlorophenolicum]KMO76826.1 hypothetical protein MCHLDSM_02975 [Mycolicibacterium chlorophenolicum]MBI5339990.1 hypothetical protein [Mycolicibacterium rufum]